MIRRWGAGQAGFSLVELFVGIAIVAILVSVAMPSMLSLIAEARLSAQTDQLMGVLNRARLSAIKERKVYTVCPAADANTASACSTSASDWSNGMLIWDGTAVVYRVVAQQGATLGATVTGVSFAGTIGSLWVSSGSRSAISITLCQKGLKQQQVDISLSGRISKTVNTTVCS